MKKISKEAYIKRIQADEELMRLFHVHQDAIHEMGDKRKLILELEAEIAQLKELIPIFEERPENRKTRESDKMIHIPEWEKRYIRKEQETEPPRSIRCDTCKWLLGGVCHYDGDSCAKDYE